MFIYVISELSLAKYEVHPRELLHLHPKIHMLKKAPQIKGFFLRQNQKTKRFDLFRISQYTVLQGYFGDTAKQYQELLSGFMQVLLHRFNNFYQHLHDKSSLKKQFHVQFHALKHVDFQFKEPFTLML